jgi:UDP-glucose 4-epimerase
MSDSISAPRVLIAGARGYIGCRLALHLARIGWQVRMGSRHPSPMDGTEELPISWVALDWSDPASLATACQDCDFVVHLAAPNEVIAGESKLEAITGTIVTTIRLLEAAKQAKVSRFLYFSTAHVYGSPLVGTLEESTNAQPRHPYSITHRCAEDFVLAETGSALLPIVIRLSNALGAPAIKETNRWKLIGNDLCRQVVEKGEIQLHSDGTALRDFIAMRDVCRAVEFLLEHQTRETSLLINVGSGISRPIREIAECVAAVWREHSGIDAPIRYGPVSASAPDFELSISKLLSLGYTFQSSLEEEILATLKHCQLWFTTPS